MTRDGNEQEERNRWLDRNDNPWITICCSPSPRHPEATPARRTMQEPNPPSHHHCRTSRQGCMTPLTSPPRRRPLILHLSNKPRRIPRIRISPLQMSPVSYQATSSTRTGTSHLSPSRRGARSSTTTQNKTTMLGTKQGSLPMSPQRRTIK
ncbi:hypothetical protein BTHE_1965 [Bifidobacterium thermophilum]|nr:hypothetical protein BTHE_1965 [Bifidobacterium thermophilum]